MRLSPMAPLLASTLLLTAALGALLGGCSSATTAGSGQQSQLATTSVPASSSVSASSSASATSTGAPGGSGSAGKGLTSSEASAIDAELSAIERELDNLQLPSDSDLKGIESGLK